MKKIPIILISSFSVILAGCGGGTSSSSSGTVNSAKAQLEVVAPTSYPSGTTLGSMTVPVKVCNIGDGDAKNVNYQIANNTSGNDSVKIADSTEANSIPAHTCTNLAVTITDGATSGAFEIITNINQDKMVSRTNISKMELKEGTTTSSVVGLVNLPAANDNQLTKALTLLSPQNIMVNKDGIARFIVSIIVSSTNPGDFNEIKLVAKDGLPLNASVEQIGGTPLKGKNMTTNSLVSFLVTVPANTDSLEFYLQTLLNGQVNDTSSIAHTVNVQKNGGILDISPSYFTVNKDFTKQIITLYNRGTASISQVTLGTELGNAFSLTSNGVASPCGSTIAAGASCQYMLEFDPEKLDFATTKVLPVEYNNGNTHIVTNVTVNADLKEAEAGLKITSDDNNFNFTNKTKSGPVSKIITITNTGNREETSFSPVLPPNFMLGTIPDAPCNFTTKLAPNGSCNYKLIYIATSVTPYTEAAFSINYKYGASSLSAATSQSISYTTLQSKAIITPLNEETAFGTILNNGMDQVAKSVKFTNIGDEEATLTQAQIVGENSSLFSVTKNECNGVLGVGKSCEITLTLGGNAAKGSEPGDKNAQLKLSYIPYSGAGTANSTVALSGHVASASSAMLSSSFVQATGFEAGSGSSEDNYVIKKQSASPTLIYQVENTGTTAATNLYLSAGLPSAWTISNTNCGSIDNKVSLAPGAKCNFTLKLNTGIAGGQTLDLNGINFSWEDQARPTGVTQQLNGKIYAYIYETPVIRLTPTKLEICADEGDVVKVNLTGGYKVEPQTVSLSSDSKWGVIVTPSCTVDEQHPSCDLKVSGQIETRTERRYATITASLSGTGDVYLANNTFKLTVKSVNECTLTTQKKPN